MLSKLIAVLGVSVAASVILAAAIFVGSLLGIALGALSGWIAGMFFPTVMIALAHLLGLTAPYQFGAACGFVGGFFKATVSSKKD